MATLETRYGDEKKKWEDEKKKLDAVLSACKSKRDEVAAAQAKLVDTSQKAYDKALGAQTKKEEMLKKLHEDNKISEENDEEAIVQAKLEEAEMMKKRLKFVDEDIAELKQEQDAVITTMVSDYEAFQAEAAAREGERAAAAAAADAAVQPFRDTHARAKTAYTDAASSLRKRREDAQAGTRPHNPTPRLKPPSPSTLFRASHKTDVRPYVYIQHEHASRKRLLI